jgi:hypothetical protein
MGCLRYFTLNIPSEHKTTFHLQYNNQEFLFQDQSNAEPVAIVLAKEQSQRPQGSPTIRPTRVTEKPGNGFGQSVFFVDYLLADMLDFSLAGFEVNPYGWIGGDP